MSVEKMELGGGNVREGNPRWSHGLCDGAEANDKKQL
jgi:hypothetical protein